MNSLPFFYGRHSDIFDFSFAPPSHLNSSAEQGLFDVSMISRWAYPLCAEQYEVLPNFCIGGDGEIVSIKLFSKFDISEINKLIVFCSLVITQCFLMVRISQNAMILARFGKIMQIAKCFMLFL